MALAIVVTTLGRVEMLSRLLHSLNQQLEPQDRVIVVAQRNVDDVERLASTFPGVTVEVTSSELGASHGRNAGVEHLDGGDYTLLFPNDSTWYPPGVLQKIRTASNIAGFRAAAFTVIDDFGPKLTLPAPGEPMTRLGVWKVIEMGLVITANEFRSLGGFDTAFGTGAATPWQSGEAADLLLRALREELQFSQQFTWLPADVWVGGVPESFGLDQRARRRKLRAYGRGAGKVSRDHALPFMWKVRLIVGGITIGLRHSQYGPLDGFWAAWGRAEGLLGRTIGVGNIRAVDR